MAKGTCTVDDCDRVHYAHDLCELHYKRLRRTGSLTRPSAAERFWPKVDKDGPLPDYRPSLGRCWVWTAGVTAGGYGQLTHGGNKGYAHRFAYEELVGAIPAGMHLDHLCRVIRCVNPGHLEPVTPTENKLRGTSANAVNARKTNCKYGHPFDGANTYFRRTGRRNCRTCNRLRARAQRRVGEN